MRLTLKIFATIFVLPVFAAMWMATQMASIFLLVCGIPMFLMDELKSPGSWREVVLVLICSPSMMVFHGIKEIWTD